MLSRTADHLFWMGRHTERAENTARMLAATLLMSLLPHDAVARESAWLAVLRISELQDAYAARHAAVTPLDVLHYMVRDAKNPSSIYSCLRAARENARAVRGSLTTEVWETVNTNWLKLQEKIQSNLLERNPGAFFEWIKHNSHLVRGAIISTMQEDEALYFLRIGMRLERADNTARMLDVKFHEHENLAPAQDLHESPLPEPAQQKEFYRWSAILNAVSAMEIYRKVYRDVISPERVAELLILRHDIPRSLLSAVRDMSADLARVANAHSGETQRRLGMLRAELEYGRVEDVFRGGLHRYLERFLECINDLGDRISVDFLMPLATHAE
jgi:uncharacterized alpha-E superfamily protein